MIKIIHQIWIQGYDKMNEHLQKYCMMWMRMYGEDWEYKFWSDDELLPFVEENYPDLYDTYSNLVPVKKSDMGRLLLLHHYGGIYADCDTIPIKRMDSLLEKYDNYDAVHCWETESDESWKKNIKQDFLKFNFPLNPHTDKKIIGSAWLYTKPNQKFILDFVNDAKHRDDQPVLQHFSTWYYTVWLIKKGLLEKNMKVLDADYCLSVVPTEKSYSIHLYDFSWRDGNSKKPWEIY
jgi:hypothetical protein